MTTDSPAAIGWNTWRVNCFGVKLCLLLRELLRVGIMKVGGTARLQTRQQSLRQVKSVGNTLWKGLRKNGTMIPLSEIVWGMVVICCNIGTPNCNKLPTHIVRETWRTWSWMPVSFHRCWCSWHKMTSFVLWSIMSLNKSRNSLPSQRVHLMVIGYIKKGGLSGAYCPWPSLSCGRISFPRTMASKFFVCRSINCFKTLMAKRAFYNGVDRLIFQIL